ncbi:hypothetical protein TNCV_3373091 [Trichonephila clavipes]|nr:hypothetical protein TNCV_3373091 [Trichonephila clavipes]
MVPAVYLEIRYANGQSASNTEELLYGTAKDREVHQRQPLRVIVFESTVMEGMTRIQRRYHSFHKHKKGITSLLSALEQIDFGVAMLNDFQRLRKKMSDTLHRSIAHFSIY